MSRTTATLIMALCLGPWMACSPAARPAESKPTASAPVTGAPPSTASVPASARPAPERVKVGLNLGSLTGAGTFVAIEKGYFAEVGLQVEVISMRLAQETMAPLATGELDVGQIGLSSATYNALARGIPLRLVADSAYGPSGFNTMALVVRKDLWDEGSFRDYSDLRGRRVATTGSGTTTYLGLDQALRRGGLSLADVDEVPLAGPDMNAALANHTIDAAIAIEPLIAAGLAEEMFTLFRWTDDVLPAMQFSAVMFSPQFGANREPANRFMLAYLRGARDYDAAVRRGLGKPTVVEALTRYTAVKDPSLYERMRFLLVNPDGRLDVDNMVWQVARYQEQGFVREPVDIAALVDHSYVDWAVAQLGPYPR